MEKKDIKFVILGLVSLAMMITVLFVAVPQNTNTITQTVTIGEQQPNKIDINKAETKALESIRGIGPVRAAEILEARQSGRFINETDLRNRVGETIYTLLEGEVYIDD